MGGSAKTQTTELEWWTSGFDWAALGAAGGSESWQILPRLSGHSAVLPMENRILHGTVCKKSGGGPAKLFL